jgi:hypothetical protein
VFPLTARNRRKNFSEGEAYKKIKKPIATLPRPICPVSMHVNKVPIHLVTQSFKSLQEMYINLTCVKNKNDLSVGILLKSPGQGRITN